ncbi:MAG: hypothetical protein KA100_04395 [Rickettsiales bacterium]|nr:hypothetical protein [Rickettsiales bacterium]
MDLSAKFLAHILDLFFEMGICIGYECGFFCCGSGLLFIFYILLFLPLTFYFLSKQQKVFAWNLISLFCGLVLGALPYVFFAP